MPLVIKPVNIGNIANVHVYIINMFYFINRIIICQKCDRATELLNQISSKYILSICFFLVLYISVLGLVNEEYMIQNLVAVRSRDVAGIWASAETTRDQTAVDHSKLSHPTTRTATSRAQVIRNLYR